MLWSILEHVRTCDANKSHENSPGARFRNYFTHLPTAIGAIAQIFYMVKNAVQRHQQLSIKTVNYIKVVES